MEAMGEIKKYICEKFIYGEPWENLPDDYDLIKNGILDSLALINLVLVIEEIFEIHIDELEITKDRFTTIAKMREFIMTKRDDAVNV